MTFHRIYDFFYRQNAGVNTVTSIPQISLPGQEGQYPVLAFPSALH